MSKDEPAKTEEEIECCHSKRIARKRLKRFYPFTKKKIIIIIKIITFRFLSAPITTYKPTHAPQRKPRVINRTIKGAQHKKIKKKQKTTHSVKLQHQQHRHGPQTRIIIKEEEIR